MGESQTECEKEKSKVWNKSLQESLKDSGVFLLLVVAVFGIQWWAWGWMEEVYPDMTQRGTFGDSFGFVNTLFSGFAFAGVIYAILLQRKELQLQRQELMETRIEIKRTAEAHGEIVKLSKIEIDERRAQEQRRATLQLVFSRYEEGRPHHDCEVNAVGITLTTTNVGETVFEACPKMYKTGQDLGLKCCGKGPLILRKGDSYQVMITLPLGIELPQDNFQFELNYVDITGLKRSQRYCVRPQFKLEGVFCMDYGFPRVLERLE